ncbi:NudC domain-containing protein 2 [Orchesella cincta]|uniref:NudC domain-containing protein 2 n=1 Tax=Orchesella cincta TaxID=48709 RepID=A0A1D2NG30_ORCCI|nr:NudC domain-containing protein 2 [Orchesella cincta]
MERLSHFEEKAGIVASKHEWGRWSQSVREVNVEVNLQPGTKAKELAVCIKPNHLQCRLADNSREFLNGKLFGTIKVDESIWTIEEKKTLRIVLTKANYSTKEAVWTSLFENEFEADKETEKQMRAKLDLERFQLEYPGMDFSSAKLSTNNK